jgi:3-oxoacyl-[acyl-carrier-protein] synthase III
VPAAVLVGLGAHVPDRVVTNDDLAAVLATDDAWIRSRTGIRERRWAVEGERTSTLAVAAGAAALKRTADGVTDADAVVLATTTPDRSCPATAPDVAAALGLGTVPAFDVAAVCSGFVYALATAQGLIAASTARRVLVIGAEVMSSILDHDDRGTAVIFGDGAGAVVLRAGEHDEPGALGPVDLGADGEQKDLIRVDPPGHLVMQGAAVYRRAIPAMAASSRAALAARGWALGDVDVLIGHQANARILDALCADLGLDPARAHVNVDRVGNTSAASIPLAMASAHAAGAVRAGDRVLLTAFGAGLTWGSTTLVWPSLPTTT